MCKEILISEHSSLREEILGLTNEIFTLQKSALYISGALWAWFASQTIPEKLLFMLYLPTAISALILLRTWAIIALIGNIDSYLSKMKEKLGLPDGLGWEKYLKKSSKKLKYLWNTLYWGFLIGGNAYLANHIIKLLTTQSS